MPQSDGTAAWNPRSPTPSRRCGVGAVLTAMVTLAAVTLSAQDVRPIGAFDNVRVSNATGESHCYGYSVEFWTYGGRVLGLLDVHGGLCGDPPCAALRDVAFDGRTGHLRFRTVVQTMPFEFVGDVERQQVSGMLNGKRVRLRRDRDAPMNVDPRPETLRSWCQFWSSVPRCDGVRDLCDTLGGLP